MTRHDRYKTIRPIFKELRRRIGQRIQAERLAQGMSLEDLFEQTGIHIEGLKNFEAGKNEISLRGMLMITDVLGVEIDALLRT